MDDGDVDYDGTGLASLNWYNLEWLWLFWQGLNICIKILIFIK